MMISSIWSIDDEGATKPWTNNVKINMGVSVRDKTSFEDLNLSGNALDKLKSMDWKRPYKIQGCVLPLLLDDYSDIVVQAPSKSGKTSAALIAVLAKVTQDKLNHVCAVIVCATRETVKEVKDVVDIMGLSCRLVMKKVNPKSIKSVPEQVVIGTPLKVQEFFKSFATPVKVDILILDDIDAILSTSGFENKERAFADGFPASTRNIILCKNNFSDSTTKVISEITNYEPLIFNFPTVVDVATNHVKFCISDTFEEKMQSLKLVTRYTKTQVLIICEKRQDVMEIAKHLDEDVLVLHKEMSDKTKERNISSFSSGNERILIMTPNYKIQAKNKVLVNVWNEDSDIEKYKERLLLLNNLPGNVMINILSKRWEKCIENKKYKLVSHTELKKFLKRYY